LGKFVFFFSTALQQGKIEQTRFVEEINIHL